MLSRIKFKIITILLLLLCLFNINVVNAKIRNTVNIYFFYSNGCSHCERERKILDKLDSKYNNINIYSYEVHDDNNKDILNEVGKIYDKEIKGTPVTVIGDTIYLGFNEEEVSKVFIKTIEYYSRYGYDDRVGNYLNINNYNLYNINDNMTLEEFMDNFYNYRLLFNVKSDDIDISNSTFLIGLLLGGNIAMLLGLFIVIYTYRKNSIRIIKYGSLYIITSIILYTIVRAISINYLSLIIFLLLLIIYIFNRKDYMLCILLASIINIFIIYLFSNYLDIFNNLLYLNNIGIWYRIIYYLELYFTYLIIPLFILIICSYFKLKKEKTV